MTSQDIVERVATALRNADLHDGDEGNHYRLFDLLDFSGENKSVMITRQLAQAAIEAAGIEALTKRVGELEGALTEARTAIIEAAQDTLWCSDKWPAETVVDHIDAVLNTVREEEK